MLILCSVCSRVHTFASSQPASHLQRSAAGKEVKWNRKSGPTMTSSGRTATHHMRHKHGVGRGD